MPNDRTPHRHTSVKKRQSRPAKKFQTWRKRLVAKGLAYWLIVAALIAVGTIAGKICEEHDFALRERYWIYQMFLYITPWKASTEETAVVLVGDQEYWQKLQGHSPISRPYLAELIRAIDRCNPRMIALDFNMAGPPPSKEDADLIKAIQEVSQRHPIVLATTLKEAGKLNYQIEPQVYSGQTFAPSVRTGHIHIFQDIRPIPVGLRLVDGKRQESFAEAIVNLAGSKVLSGFQDDEEQPFATFLPRQEFTELGAGSVLAGQSTGPLGKLNGKIVIVSGDWTKDSLAGGHIDDWNTPVGIIPGSFVQANYIEALLNSRTYRELSLPAALALEIVLSLALVVLFSLNEMSWWKFLGLCVAVIATGYFLLENAGRYYDFYFPLLLLAAHGAVEQIKETWLE